MRSSGQANEDNVADIRGVMTDLRTDGSPRMRIALALNCCDCEG